MVTALVHPAAPDAPKAVPPLSRVMPAKVVKARLTGLMQEARQMGLGQLCRGIERAVSVLSDSDRRPGA